MATNTKKSAIETLATAEVAIANEAKQLKNATLRGSVYERRVSCASSSWKTDLEFNVQIDFKGVSLEQLYAWAGAKLIIDLQRQMRTLSYEFAQNLSKSTVYRPAADMGMAFADPAAQAKKVAAMLNQMSDADLEAFLAARKAAKESE